MTSIVPTSFRRHRVVQWLLGLHWSVVAAVGWVVRYLTLGRIPVLHKPIWADWFDQSRYLASAVAFAGGDLSASAHWYPLGYPLLAAPFVGLMPDDPFFLLDLMLFLVTCAGFQRTVRAVGVGRWAATAAFLATAFVQKDIAAAWAHPWTSTLSAALTWWLLAGTTALFDRDSPAFTRRGALLLGALSAALPLVRPVDALVGAICLVVAGNALARRRGLTPGIVAAVLMGGLAVSVPYGLLYLAIYGPHPTAYMVAAAKTGFVPGDLGWKAHVLLVDPRPWFPASRSILETFPWILPGAAGLIAWGIVERGRARAVLVLLALVIVPVGALMLTYIDLQPPGLWEFGNIHYFKWVMPLFGVGIALWGRLLATTRGRGVLAATMLALLVPLGIRIDPVPVGDDVPARMLTFRGDTHRGWNEAYFASVVLRDDAGTQANVRDFHQVPDAGGERAIAERRLFAAHPRRTDPGEPGGIRDQPPIARYAERITLGLP